MKITRTANAGVLIESRGQRILFDGVCEKLPPYEETPLSIREELTENPPDIVVFTHRHKDHFDSCYARKYEEKTLRPVSVAECPLERAAGGVKITAVPTRHIGKNDVPHCSYVIEGDICVWFSGDASPTEWKKHDSLPKPDVLIVPYAYTITKSGWQAAKDTGAEKIVLLHMPQKALDEYSLWRTMEEITRGDSSLIIPDIGSTLCF